MMLQKEQGPSGSDDAIAGVANQKKYTNKDQLQKVLDWLDKLEVQLQTKIGSSTASDSGGSRPRRMEPARIVCWTCKEEGHLSQNCIPTQSEEAAGKRETLGEVSRSAKGESKALDDVAQHRDII